MRECANGEMRDLLPDLLHDRLTAELRIVVQAHVDGCADCRAELAILRRVMAINVAPRVDASRIAAAVPPYRGQSAWGRAANSPLVRIAAAILLLAGAAAVITNAAGRSRPPEPVPQTVQAPVSPANVEPAPVPTAPPRGPTTGVAHRAPMELAVGESFHDLSDAELRTLLEELGKLEAVTSTETEAVAPSLGRGGQ